MLSQTTKVLFRVSDDKCDVILQDAFTKERLLTTAETELARQEAEARAQLEFQARLEAEAQVQLEFQARLEAEARVRELEKRVRELEANQ